VASIASVTFPCRDPFDWPQFLDFFAARATPGVESVDGGVYRRTWAVDGRHQILEVRPDAAGGALRVGFAGSRARPRQAVVGLARRVFDADAPLENIGAGLRRDATLRRMLTGNPGVRVPGAWDGFELTVRAILGQQISVRAATTIAGRIARRYGEPVDLAPAVSGQGLDRLFPTPERLMRARFNDIGLVQTRIDTIRRVSAAVVAGDLAFDGSRPGPDVRATLLSIRGIGPWTAEYVAMRALKDPDAFPGADLGLLSAIAHPDRVTPVELAGRAESWRPWRAYAAMLLWGSLPGAGG
jgi:AraC family transcriptional regulator of adaptative response / DNA-3-methyladenine glycosylase II